MPRSTRRQFLRDLGIGAAALPFVLNLPSLGFANQQRRKQRLVVLFSPNGVVPGAFWPDEEGTNFTLKESLTPLQPYKDRTLILHGVNDRVRRRTLEGIRSLNEMNYRSVGDQETHTRIQQYEMAYRMQTSVPDLVNLAREPARTFELYGDQARRPGTFANSVLMARRLVERGVRFVQIYHNNWDTHANVAGRLPSQCRDVDQACYGLIRT